MCLSSLRLPHSGHTGFSSLRISNSKSLLHLPQVYSYKGMTVFSPGTTCQFFVLLSTNTVLTRAAARGQEGLDPPHARGRRLVGGVRDRLPPL